MWELLNLTIIHKLYICTGFTMTSTCHSVCSRDQVKSKTYTLEVGSNRYNMVWLEKGWMGVMLKVEFAKNVCR